MEEPGYEEEKGGERLLAPGDPTHRLDVGRMEEEEQRRTEGRAPIPRQQRQEQEEGIGGGGVPERVRDPKARGTRAEGQGVEPVAEPVERQVGVEVPLREKGGDRALQRPALTED